MKRKLGMTLIALLWGFFVLGVIYPADIHGGYPAPVFLVKTLGDLVLLYLPATIAKAITGSYPEFGIPIRVLWTAFLSAGLYFFLIRKRNS